MNRILIGKIVNTHGIKGELKVLSETDFRTQRYRSDHPVFISFRGEFLTVKVKKYRPHQGFDLLTLEGFEDINLVEKFRGCELYAEDEPVRDLPPGEYTAVSLLGCSVLQQGILQGTVSGIRTYPQGDYLEIQKTDGSPALVPFRDEFVVKVDMANRTLEIVEMEGLL